jgi:hypothetical protein
VYVAGDQQSLKGVTGPSGSVTKLTGKQPNLLLFYQAWDSAAKAGKSNLDTAAMLNACNAGMLPMLTWESWDTTDKSGGATVIDQPAFSPAKIAAGTYDTYVRQIALAIKGLGAKCPIALRLDQEPDGNWYPWGANTTGMTGNTPADYIKMWRHVWKIFANQGVTNVLWVWSPNYEGPKAPTPLSALYPGSGYVDWVGIDAYYSRTGLTFAALFDPTILALRTFAADKPWIVSETGVGGPPKVTDKPSGISNLLAAIIRRPHFNGLVYFDSPAVRNDWRFNQTGASLAAFKSGINNSQYATGKPGTL